MRHRVYGKHLGRNKNERKALFKGLVRSLLSYGTIRTSEVKAKAIKGLVDKIINSVKSNTKQNRLVDSFVDNKDLCERLIKEIVPKLGSRTSGFTRTVRMGTRMGDQTTIVKMSLIGAEDLKPIEKGSKAQNLDVSKKTVQIKEKEIKEKEKVKSVRRASRKKAASI
ncbi:50S ribosomal protein L17 [Patescibacteria group bacterium]|nr:50S ribosomal protein L17 [Patescibacteria group bacterium]